MKMLKATIIIIVAVIAINIILIISTASSIEKLVMAANTGIVYLEKNDIKNAQVCYDSFSKELDRHNLLLKLSLPHSSIEDIELDCSNLKYYLKFEDKENSIITFDTIKEKLHFINDRQRLYWHNLF